jgi:hypothetical protein
MMPYPLVQALIAHFDSVFERPNSDYPAVLEADAYTEFDLADSRAFDRIKGVADRDAGTRAGCFAHMERSSW